MSKKYLLVPLALLIVAGTAASAEAFSFRGLLERLHLARPAQVASTTPRAWGLRGQATSTRPFFGTITVNNGDSITVNLTQGMMIGRYRSSSTPQSVSQVIKLTSDTKYIGGTKDSLTVGTKIAGQAKIGSDDSLTAVQIHINPPQDGSGRPTTSPNRLHRGSDDRQGGFGKSEDFRGGPKR